MPPRQMSREAKNYRLLLSMIKQLKVSGRAINWQLVADDLGLRKAAAPNLRWCRFKKEQRQRGVLPPEDNEVGRRGGSGGRKRKVEAKVDGVDKITEEEREMDMRDDDEGEEYWLDIDDEA